MHNFFNVALFVFVSIGEAKIKTTCELPCVNGGICKGRRLDELVVDHPRRFGLEHNQRQYCECPHGYAGAMCEIKLVLCANGNQTCSNGNTCQRTVDPSGSEYFHCECDREKSDLSLPYAVRYCEHVSTVFCIDDSDADNIKHSRESLGGSAKSSFCTNGGRCKEVTEQGHHHAGCNCPKGYSGQHCEISSDSKEAKASSLEAPPISKRPKTNVFVTFLLFLGFFLGFTVLSISMLIWYGNRNRIPRKSRSAQERSKIPKQSSHSDDEVV
jgi:hypothetical protein